MGITPLGLNVILTVSGQTHMQPYIYDIYMKMLDNRYRIDILSTIMSDMLWTLVFIRRGRQKITEVPKIRKVISTANPVPIFIKKIWRNSYRNTIIPPDSKWVYRWPGACQMRCTWWWGRTCRPPDKAGPWPVWAAVISSSSQHEGDITCTLRRTRLREASAARARPWRWGAWWGRPGGQTPPSWSSECSCKI